MSEINTPVNGNHHNGNQETVTEIRATENSKGGVAYEVILSPAVKESTPKRLSPPPKTNLSIDDISEKLKAAEKRRESFESRKLGQWNEHRNRLEEATAKRQASYQSFVEEKSKFIEIKLQAASENRDAQIMSKVEKLKEHEENVIKARRSIEEKQQQLSAKLEKKLEIVQENREMVIQKKLENLRDHDRRVEEIRNLKLNKATEESASG